MKTLHKKMVKVSLVPYGMFKREEPGIYFLIYHRVTGDLGLELDMPFPVFRKQIEHLAGGGNVVSFDSAVDILRSGQRPSRDLFVITFDDGYADLFSHVFPLIKDLSIPVILFPATGPLESGAIKVGRPFMNKGVDPVSWDQLGKVTESGLVTVGAHTHSHLDMTELSDEEICREMERSKGLFKERLGYSVKHFAYPKAIWNKRVEQIVRRYFETAVIGGGRKATVDGHQSYRIPRVPIRRSDGWIFFLAKTKGLIRAEEEVYSRLKGTYNMGQ